MKWTSITGWAVGAAALSGAVFHQQAAVLYTNTAAWVGSALEQSSAYQAPAGTYPGPVHVKILSNSTEPTQSTQKATTATVENTKPRVDNTVKATASQPAPTTSQPVSSASQSAQTAAHPTQATSKSATATQQQHETSSPSSTNSFSNITVPESTMSGTTTLSFRMHTGTTRLTFYSPVGTVYTPLTWVAGEVYASADEVSEEFYNPSKPYERLFLALFFYSSLNKAEESAPAISQTSQNQYGGTKFYPLQADHGRTGHGVIQQWQANGQYYTFVADGYADRSPTGAKTHPTSVIPPFYPGSDLLVFGWTK